MTRYTVQYILPVNNPESNVRMARVKDGLSFEVPINYKDSHKLTLEDLIAAAELSGLFTVSPALNKNIKLAKEDISKLKKHA